MAVYHNKINNLIKPSSQYLSQSKLVTLFYRKLLHFASLNDDKIMKIEQNAVAALNEKRRFD